MAGELNQAILNTITNRQPVNSLNNDLQNQLILQEVLSQSPVFQNLYNPKNTGVIFASPERVAANQSMGGGGGLEFWPVEEPGRKGFEHPASQKKTILEIFDPNLKANPQALKQALYGDLLHGLVKDPQWATLREEFSQNFTPQTLNMLSREGRTMNDSEIDSFIRGYISPDQNAEFLRAHQAGKPVYSPRQVEILNRMKSYLNTGK